MGILLVQKGVAGYLQLHGFWPQSETDLASLLIVEYICTLV